MKQDKRADWDTHTWFEEFGSISADQWILLNTQRKRRERRAWLISWAIVAVAVFAALLIVGSN